MVMHAARFLFDHGHSFRNVESVHDNVFWKGAAPRLSVCVPAFRHDASALVAALARCNDAALIEVIVYDDGSQDHDLLAAMQAAAGIAPAAVRIVSSWTNRGRSAARNAAISHARSEWILLLDADMTPDSTEFIEAYLNAMERTQGPHVIVGGYSLRSAPKDRAFALHRWQACASECAPARQRCQAPGRYVFASNVLVHLSVLEACPFDEGFAGWGWEDTDWGLSVQRRFPIVHIDNTATHMGLDADDQLMGKYARSGYNFARMALRHPIDAAAMPLYRMARRARRLPFRRALKALAGEVARSTSLPLGLRGRALKAWRALVYAEAL
jgi:glycosyltransferase involved in cell wall biosynthesis